MIGVRVGKVINRFKVGKHFLIRITDDSFSYAWDTERIRREAILDGMYVIRTSVAEETLDAESVARTYKDLSKVEKAFRCCKTIDLNVRPIRHRLADRVRSPVFLCMLAYYVEWHMRKALAPLLFEDHPRNQRKAQSIVALQRRSPAVAMKARTR